MNFSYFVNFIHFLSKKIQLTIVNYYDGFVTIQNYFFYRKSVDLTSNPDEVNPLNSFHANKQKQWSPLIVIMVNVIMWLLLSVYLRPTRLSQIVVKISISCD